MVRKQLGIPAALGLSTCVLLALLGIEPVEAKPKRSEVPPPVVAAPEEEEPDHNELTDKMVGFYVGQLGPSKMTIRLEKIIGNSVIGYSVVAGNQRAFSGSFADRRGVMEFVVREPGDNPYDGEFSFRLGPEEPPKLVGIWKPYDKKLATKEFTAIRRGFRYDPKVGHYPQSSTRRLKASDVENMRQEELRIMRNEMYARHGYSFKLKDMREHFEDQDWYMPMSTDVSSKLTPIEQANHELIKRYENYSAQYYDNFGR